MYSMTGFAQAQATFAHAQLDLELKSYNNRYLEFSCPLPACLAHMEQWTRKSIAEKIARGKVFLSIKISSSQSTSVQINSQKIKEFIHIQQQLAHHGILSNYSFSDLQRYGIFESDQEAFPDELYEQTFTKTLETLQESRAMEGRQLALDITTQLDELKNLVNEIESIVPQIDQHIRDSLRQQFEEVLQEPVGQQRIMEEIASYLIKTNVHEEIVRLQAHIASMNSLLISKGSVGRKIDFFCQELQREATTLCNKTPSVEVQQLAVEMKNTIEKIREQGRNVE